MLEKEKMITFPMSLKYHVLKIVENEAGKNNTSSSAILRSMVNFALKNKLFKIKEGKK